MPHHLISTIVIIGQNLRGSDFFRLITSPINKPKILFQYIFYHIAISNKKKPSNVKRALLSLEKLVNLEKRLTDDYLSAIAR